jgi:hypothetical protein
MCWTGRESLAFGVNTRITVTHTDMCVYVCRVISDEPLGKHKRQASHYREEGRAEWPVSRPVKHKGHVPEGTNAITVPWPRESSLLIAARTDIY